MHNVNLNFGGWIRVIRTFAASHNLGIEYVDQEEIDRMGAQAWTDGSKIYVQAPDTGWDNTKFKLWVYFILHELGHNTKDRREMFIVLKNKKPEPGSMLAYVNNVLEDRVQEHCLSDTEQALAPHIQSGRFAFYDFMLDDSPVIEKHRTEAPESITLMAWDAECRQDWMQGADVYRDKILGHAAANPQVIEWLGLLSSGGYDTELRQQPTPARVFEIAEEIVRDVFKQDPAEQQNQSKKGKAEGEGQPGDGQGDPADGKGEGKGKNVPKNGKEEGKGPGKSEKGATVDYNDLLTQRHDNYQPSKSDGKGLRIDYSEYFKTDNSSYRKFTPDFKDLIVYNTTRGEMPKRRRAHINRAVPPSTLSRRVSRYLQVITKNRRLHGQKSGKLSSKNLHRLKIKDGGAIRERVFNKKVVNKALDVSVTLLCDLSGSMMDDDKSQALVNATVHLHEVLAKSLRVPLEIIGFCEARNDGKITGEHTIIESYGGKTHNTNKIEQIMREITPANGRNRDGEAILWAYHRIMQQKTARKIILVLSDGQPSSSCGDVAGFTKDVIRTIEREKKVDIYAIGIMSDTVQYFYNKSEVLLNSGQLEAALLNLLKTRIIIPTNLK